LDEPINFTRGASIVRDMRSTDVSALDMSQAG
jgi:hypothetical protein